MVIQKAFRRQLHGDKCTHNVTGDEYILIIMSFVSLYESLDVVFYPQCTMRVFSVHSLASFEEREEFSLKILKKFEMT